MAGFGFCIAGVVVWCLMGILCVYAMFLIALSNIALAVLLALGPLFFACCFSMRPKDSFPRGLRNSPITALITILTVMIAALLLQIVQSYAAQTAARGSAILTVDALNMLLIAVLVFLILRQVMPIASGLAGGLALSSFGLLSRTMRWGMQTGIAAGVPTARFAVTHIPRIIAATPGYMRSRIGELSRSWRRPRT